MNLLAALVRRILLPPLLLLSLTAAYRLYQGIPVNLLLYLKTLVFLAGAVLAIWAPLPLVRHISDRAPEQWKSVTRILLGVGFGGSFFGILLYLVIHFDLFE